MLGQIERYIKQAVVDRNSVVASSALVSGIHMMKVHAGPGRSRAPPL